MVGDDNDTNRSLPKFLRPESASKRGLDAEEVKGVRGKTTKFDGRRIAFDHHIRCPRLQCRVSGKRGNLFSIREKVNAAAVRHKRIEPVLEAEHMQLRGARIGR